MESEVFLRWRGYFALAVDIYDKQISLKKWTFYIIDLLALYKRLIMGIIREVICQNISI